MELKRRIFSILLLAVFLPALVASSVHRHHADAHEGTVECVDCHHQSGHLASGAQGLDECLLCQFLGLPFVVALLAAALPLDRRVEAFYGFLRQRVSPVGLRHNRSRAPPVPVLSA